MRPVASLCAFLLALPLTSQHGSATAPPSAPHPKTGSAPPATHRAQPSLPPEAALAHVRAGNAAFAAARASGGQTPAAPPRPAGAGRYTAAVVACADAQVDVPALFGLAPKDVLVISTPGAVVHGETAALLERAILTERLSLVVVLTHGDCASLAPPKEANDLQAGLEHRARLARAFAARRRIDLPKAQALLQRELLLASSDLLQVRAGADALRVVPASVDPKSGLVTWHTTRAEELPIAPVK
jgi:carbonic anhydrase